MATVNFYIEKRKDKAGNIRTENVPIIMNFHFDGGRLIYFTGERINKEHWDSEEQAVKRNVAGRTEINNILQCLRDDVLRIYREAKLQGISPTNAYLLNHLRKEKPNKDLFFSQWNDYIAAKVQEHTHGFIKHLQTTKRHFEAFCKKSGIAPEFDSITIELLEKFRDYLILKRGMSHNSVAGNIKRVKFFLNYAYKNGNNTNTQFRDFKITQKEGQIYYLTWDELMMLYNAKLPTERLSRIRDIFCFGCLTGMRISDVINLKKTDIKGEFVHFKTIKTQEDNSVPLNDYSKEILERNKNLPGNNALPKYSTQKVNVGIKELGKLMEINEPVSVIKFVGGKRIEKTVPKWMVLSSHIGRKTFITNSVIKGMRTEVIMSISGHKTHAAFRRYYKLVDEHRLTEMKKYFSK